MICSIYCDGGVVLKNPSVIGGSWAYVYTDDQGVLTEQSGFVMPGVWPTAELEVVTNNFTEMLAACKALHFLPDGWNGTLYSDSKITLGRLFHSFKWHGIPDDLRLSARSELDRLGRITPVLLDGHPTKTQLLAGIGKRGQPVSAFNVRCDELCRIRNAECLSLHRIDQEVRPATNLAGVV